jgi:hypothetical protein
MDPFLVETIARKLAVFEVRDDTKNHTNHRDFQKLDDLINFQMLFPETQQLNLLPIPGLAVTHNEFQPEHGYGDPPLDPNEREIVTRAYYKSKLFYEIRLRTNASGESWVANIENWIHRETHIHYQRYDRYTGCLTLGDFFEDPGLPPQPISLRYCSRLSAKRIGTWITFSDGQPLNTRYYEKRPWVNPLAGQESRKIGCVLTFDRQNWKTRSPIYLREIRPAYTDSGFIKTFYPNGRLKSITRANGVMKFGHATCYHDNGQKRSYVYRIEDGINRGCFFGPFFHWNRQGELTHVEYYDPFRDRRTEGRHETPVHRFIAVTTLDFLFYPLV